jgi:trimethylamine--corrinoid protein Co-methyltransferase
MESATTAMLAVLGGIDMVSGAGMLDFLLCQSAEKLVVDAEAIAAARRLARGIATPTATLATGMFASAGPEGRFLEIEETRRLFRGEQHLPSAVIDRGSHRAWAEAGSRDTFGRARERVAQLLAAYRRPAIESTIEEALVALVRAEAAKAGLERLPGLPGLSERDRAAVATGRGA